MMDEKRIPCVIIVDTSDSMTMDGAFGNMNQWLRKLEVLLKRNTEKSSLMDIIVISAADEVSLVQDFCPGNEFSTPKLLIGGNCMMNQAIVDALDLLELKKRDYHTAGIAYQTPWLFIITAGAADDDDNFIFTDERLFKAVSGKEIKLNVVFAGKENANSDNALVSIYNEGKKFASMALKHNEEEKIDDASRDMKQEAMFYFDDFDLGITLLKPDEIVFEKLMETGRRPRCLEIKEFISVYTNSNYNSRFKTLLKNSLVVGIILAIIPFTNKLREAVYPIAEKQITRGTNLEYSRLACYIMGDYKDSKRLQQNAELQINKQLAKNCFISGRNSLLIEGNIEKSRKDFAEGLIKIRECLENKEILTLKNMNNNSEQLYRDTCSELIYWYLYTNPQYDDLTKWCLGYISTMNSNDKQYQNLKEIIDNGLPKAYEGDMNKYSSEIVSVTYREQGANGRLKASVETAKQAEGGSFVISRDGEVKIKFNTPLEFENIKITYYKEGTYANNVYCNFNDVEKQYECKFNPGSKGKYVLHVLDEKLQLIIGLLVLDVKKDAWEI